MSSQSCGSRPGLLPGENCGLMSHFARTAGAVDISLTTRNFDHIDSARLLRAYAVERREVVGFDDLPDLDKPFEFAPPCGRFVVVYSAVGEPIACGGFRTYPERDAVVEVRKMYVDPRHRRLGLGSLVLAALEKHAAEQGAHEVILETGSYNRVATRMYESAGYHLIPAYVPGRPDFNRAYSKTLSPLD
ncbi:GNAT family N-acetyltransferase [Nocardia sp. CA-107356]|uniref:GNAT family N-acetyltransferase n=1 Tax=Nocardia sp. CA-107356 TaxID=3239972 RepID=UPI003D8EC35D